MLFIASVGEIFIIAKGILKLIFVTIENALNASNLVLDAVIAFIAQQVNVFRFFYSSKYNQGTVNVAFGSQIVFGNGTQWLDNIKEGANFKLAGSNVLYSVQSVNTD